MADALSNLETNAGYPCNVGLSVMDQSFILSEAITTIDQQVEKSWMTPITDYLRAKVVKVKARAARYSILNRELYWRSFSGPYLRCLPIKEAKHIVQQVHQGLCETHIGGRTLCHLIVT